MKHYILILVIALISCSTSDDPTPAQSQPTKFDSIVGDWVFKVDNISGSFSIAEFSGELVVDNVGQFTVDNVNFNITERSRKIINSTIPGTYQSFFLINTNTGTTLSIYFGLHECSVNSSFTEITCKQYSYDVGTWTLVDHKVVLTRK